jgi:GrpB-like predicted nucleotidyltransferase (UPF0157 family)
MHSEEIVHFLPTEEIFEKAKVVFENQKSELERILPPVDIQHVGSCAVPGMIGKFDVDIQIRVTKEKFSEIVENLKKNYKHKHPEMWTSEFAIFSNNKEYHIDLVVTVIDSRYDDFYRVRDALIADPNLLKEYNNLKRKFEGKKYAEYREAKMKFFGGNGNVRFLKY